MKLSQDEFLDQLQKAYEYFAEKSLKEKNVPVTKENLKHEVRTMMIFSAAYAFVNKPGGRTDK